MPRPDERTRGMTLIEVLLVVVVMGILAAIAIPKYGSMRRKAYIAAVTSDLRNLASQQEVYHHAHDVYAADLSSLPNLRVTPNVNLTLTEAGAEGWAATGTHDGLAGKQCGIFYGSADPTHGFPATAPGMVICQK